MLWKTPRMRVRGADVRPQLPALCRERTPPTVEHQEAAIVTRWQADCGSGGLIGARVGIDGLASANTNGLIRVTLADGRSFEQVVTHAAPALQIPRPPRRIDIWQDYCAAGARHVLLRADRILFLLGLLMLAPVPRLMAQTLAAFTFGHSITLPAATFGYLGIPSRAIEIVLAITLLTLATELAREPRMTWMRRFPSVIGFAFGLLHGLGFAAVLNQIELPSTDAPLAAFAFNLGIEVGQFAFVLAALLVLRCVQALRLTWPRWVMQAPVYVMGSLAVFWFLEHASAALR